MRHSVLKPFQKEGVRAIRALNFRALLADEQGLGKTIQALFVLFKRPDLRPAFIIAPASLKYNWQAEAKLHFNQHIEVLEGRKASAKRIDPEGIYVLNYEIAFAWREVIRYRQAKAVIFDEAHKIKNPETQQSRAVLHISKTVKMALALSGTPMTNRPIELWPTLNVVRPDLFPSREKFAWRYCKPVYTRWGWQYTGATRMKELNTILKENLMIRRLKEDVLPELPAKQRRVIPFRLSSYKEYNRAQNQFLEWLKNIDPVKAKRAKKSQGLTKVGYLLRLVSELKRQWVVSWIRDFLEDGDSKLVTFTCHTAVVDTLLKEFKNEVVYIDGRVTRPQERQKAVRLFQTNPTKRLFVGNVHAAGTGLTLTASSHVAFLDLPHTPGDLAQAEDRVHRIGQKNKVTIHYLITLDTMEEKLCSIIQSKSKVLSAIMDSGESAQDIDIYSELITSLKNDIEQKRTSKV